MSKMFKKIFGGNNKEGKSKDGTTIYNYEDTKVQSSNKIAKMLYIDEISDHFENVFPDRTTNVFHEITSETIHLDVHCMEPTDEEQFRVLYTTGMSDLPMTLPDEIPSKEALQLNRAELMLFLPADWPIDEKSIKEENNYWPIRLLKQLARFPHQYSTWLGHGHTIPNYAEYEPYAENTGLNGVILSALKDDISLLKTKDNNIINIYLLIPLYKEEMEYKLKNGMDALFEKLSEINGGGLFLDKSRSNTCS